MGIELPAELAAIAHATGVSWPEADEDALREQAESWRKAARELAALAGDADACAAKALGALAGPTAEAARARWASLGDVDSGLLTEAARGATQAADRLEHAAEQVGRAKVELVRQLVEAARTHDAAVVAAGSGHPSALLGLDTVLRGVAGDLGTVTQGLVEAVAAPAAEATRPPSAVPVDVVDTVVPDDAEAVGVPAVPEAVEPAGLGEAVETADAVDAVEELVADSLDEPAGDGNPGEELLPDPGVVAVGPPPDALSTEDTGPIAISQLPTPPSGQQVVSALGADAPTPPSGTAFRPPDAPAPYAAGPAPQPGQTHLSGFAPSAAPNPVPNASLNPVPNPMPNPAPGPVPAPGQYAPPQWGGYAAAPGQPPVPPGPVPPGPQAQYRATPWNAQYPAAPYAPQVPPPLPGHPPQAHAPQQSQQPQQPPQPPQPAPPRQQPAAPPPAPHPGAAAVAVGAPRQERESVVALFVVHMFPIGHLPVPADRPARQLPVPSGDTACGVLRFPPHDHPASDTIETEHALSALRGGGRRPAPPPAEVLPGVPDDLTEGHDPLGEVSELEWDRRYLVRDGERPEYAWPPPERFPEGCHEPGEPVLLEEGTVLDRFGTAHGRVFSADGTRFAQRSLPPSYLGSGYRRYRVVRRLPAWKAVSAPWFGQPGGGVRYRTVYSAAELVVLGHLADITFEERA